MATKSLEPIFIEIPDNISVEAVPDNFVSYVLKHQEALPPVTWKNWYSELDWQHVFVLFVPLTFGLIGAWHTPLRLKTGILLLVYTRLTGFGITAGYHRLWAHRTYKATRTLEYILAVLGAGTLQGPITWWARGHRAHHRYTDTDLDPYDARKGLFYSHMGWLIFRPRRKPGPADISDLRSNPVVKWQHKYYLLIAFITVIVVPTCVAGYGWKDWQGGFVWTGLIRLVIVQHSTFCVNSLAHWLGDQPYDDKHTPKDSTLTALITLGEGYHNFHHQFPMDYRNGYKWYQYDPTKWFLWSCEKVGLATHLNTFSENEIKKGELTVQLRRLLQKQEVLTWPAEKSDLPVITWEDYQCQAKSRALICIGGYIHDVSDFFDKHPGGAYLLEKHNGKDATSAFFGGIYDHGSAAHNLLAMKRVGILLGGAPHGSEEQFVPPSQHLRVSRYDELSL
ncbi:delta 9-fatty acid desaturase protein [Boletus reticuloceps]|uniref:Acyl-CoA desaturase n=1 Tax=Boletus reticuloceps TaxID=495285 RepID=A0A8I3A3U4_9AGAM|nr:delta 9-fatty acid desaturase protein [Boletus reticuloceps]